MNPRNILRQTLLFVTLVTLAFIINPSEPLAFATDPGTIIGYCASDPDLPVVYFSSIFDTNLNPNAVNPSRPIENEFNEYLKGRFDVNGNANHSLGCPLFRSVSLAKVGQRDHKNQMRRSNKQIVDVKWRYTPDTAEFAASFLRPGYSTTSANDRSARPTHTYCFSEGFKGTIYSTGPFDTDGNANYERWRHGFSKFLRKKYDFWGRVDCNVAAVTDVQRLMNAHIAGAHAAGRKVVDTGWRSFPDEIGNSPRPPQPDYDPEPLQRQLLKTRELAVKEWRDSLAYCRKDRSLSAVFRCDAFARAVYNYRVAHATDPDSQWEPPASLVASDKLNCDECIDKTRVDFWIRKHAAAGKLSTPATNCVTQSVINTLYKKPQPRLLKQFFDEAVAACNK